MLELVFLLLLHLLYISFWWVTSPFGYPNCPYFLHFSHCHIYSLLQNCTSQPFVVLCLWSGQSPPIAGLMIEESLMIHFATFVVKYILHFGLMKFSALCLCFWAGQSQPIDRLVIEESPIETSNGGPGPVIKGHWIQTILNEFALPSIQDENR